MAWQKAMDLVDAVYLAARQFPKTEMFGLTQQLKNAAIAVPSLLAEGTGRYTVGDQRHFYREARGLLKSLERSPKGQGLRTKG